MEIRENVKIFTSPRLSDMSFRVLLLFFGLSNIFAQCESDSNSVVVKNPIRFSQDFLLAIKTEQDHLPYLDTLSKINITDLKENLMTKEQKLSFWINCYNACVQSEILKDPKALENQNQFFKHPSIDIGGNILSLDDIESGILRRKKVKGNQQFIKTFRVEQLDSRIHFTLNCGATSCPPIAYYSPENIEEELKLAEESFLTQTSIFNKAENTLEISQLFEWFEDDFGGYEAILERFRRLNIISPNDRPKLKYAPYNWNIEALNFN